MKNNVSHFNFSALLIVVFLSFLACKNETTKQGWNTYRTPYYQITYPEKFEFVKKGQYDEKGDQMLQQAEFFLYVNDSTSDEKKGFRPNINLLVQDISNLNYTLKDYVELSEKQILNLIKDSEIVTSDSHNDFHRITYKGSLDQRELFFYQHYEIYNKQAFILTFSAQNTTFKEQIEIVKSVFDNFKLK